MTGALVRLIALLVPHASRSRWREEWRAELACVERDHGILRALQVGVGALPDAIVTRRLAAHSRRGAQLSGPRAGVFHAVDQDLRYACRGLVKAPGFAVGVVLSLAIGIGANAAAFSFVNATVLRPFPGVKDQQDLVRLTLGAVQYQRFSTVDTTHRDFITLRDGMTTLAGLSAYRDATFAISADGVASAVRGTLVSGNYFDVLGVRAAAGRFFLDREDRTAWTHPVVVISDELWERLYHRAPSAIGRSLLVNGADLQIVGVAPHEFTGVTRSWPKIWVPMAMGELTLRGRDGHPARVETAGPVGLDYVGRRRRDVTIEQVSAEAASFRERLDATRSAPRSRVTVLRVWVNDDPSRMAPQIAAFMVVPMLVLVIACVNAANLVLARSSRRVRDWTVRLAVGATRWRVVRQVLAEAMILSAVATALGLLLTRWGLSLIVREFPIPMPLDHRVALFTVTLAVLTAVTFSLGPALSVTSRATRRLASGSYGTGAAVRYRTRFILVALQAALCLGLLATGAQFTKTVQAAAASEPVPHAESLVLASVDVDPLRLDHEAGDDFYRRLLDRVNLIPGVGAAGLAPSGLDSGLIGRDASARILLPDSRAEAKSELAFHVSSRFFEAVAVPLLQGRRFTPADETAVRTVIVNKAFADKFVHGHALGRTFRVGPPLDALRDAGTARGSSDVIVVGVVGGMLKMAHGLLEPPILYFPAPLLYQPARMLFIRLDGTGTFSAAALHAAAREVDARVPLTRVVTLADVRRDQDRVLRFLSRAVGVLGILALLLAAGGLYSVVAYIVSLRRQEVGVRLALGADARSIVGMIVRQALLPTVMGAIVGAFGAGVAGAIIRSRMYGVSPVDPLAFGAATLLMLGVMLLASWLPARQAGRVDPLSVLRQE